MQVLHQVHVVMRIHHFDRKHTSVCELCFIHWNTIENRHLSFICLWNSPQIDHTFSGWQMMSISPASRLPPFQPGWRGGWSGGAIRRSFLRVAGKTPAARCSATVTQCSEMGHQQQLVTFQFIPNMCVCVGCIHSGLTLRVLLNSSSSFSAFSSVRVRSLSACFSRDSSV